MKEFVEKLIGRLEEYKTKAYVTGFTNSPYEFGACNGMNSAIEIVNQLAEEYKEKDCSKCSRRSWYQKGYADAEKNNGWIPCEFELPKYTGEYNVTVVVASELGSFEDVTTLRFENIKGKEPIWVIPKDEIYRVIAWQPLPEPYKKGE